MCTWISAQMSFRWIAFLRSFYFDSSGADTTGAIDFTFKTPFSTYLSELIRRTKRFYWGNFTRLPVKAVAINSAEHSSSWSDFHVMSRRFALIAAERFYMKIECSNNGMCRKRSHDAKISIAQAPFRPRVHENCQGRVCFRFHMVPAFLFFSRTFISALRHWTESVTQLVLQGLGRAWGSDVKIFLSPIVPPLRVIYDPEFTNWKKCARETLRTCFLLILIICTASMMFELERLNRWIDTARWFIGSGGMRWGRGAEADLMQTTLIDENTKNFLDACQFSLLIVHLLNFHRFDLVFVASKRVFAVVVAQGQLVTFC